LRVAALVAVLLTVSALVSPARAADETKPEDRFRGGRVEWARLRHGGEYWDRHAGSDDTLLGFIRANTTLDIDPVWHAAPASDLAAMTQYPFLFADTLQFLNDAEQRNLAEFLRRGGFVFLDACCNRNINPDPERYRRDHLRILGQMFPDLRVEELSPEHEVFSIYFRMERFPPQTWSPSWSGGPTNPLRALYDGPRLIGIMSISALQCGWARVEGGDPVPAMKMLTNIYLYAITR
jgi:hypothetical protein